MEALDPDKQVSFVCKKKVHIPSRCNTTVTRKLGTRKWTTKYVVYSGTPNAPEEKLSEQSGKGEARQAARMHTIQHDKPAFVRIEKVSTTNNCIVIQTTPKEKRMGTWTFRASFLY
jgi:hypothetical protein